MSLTQLRESVCQANLDLVHHGLVTLTWGNVSGLADDREVFAIKPSGVTYEKLLPEHMVLVKVSSGDIVEGNLRPSSDTPTHRLLYQAFNGVAGITHSHSPKATAWAQARRPIPCLGTTHADHFNGMVPITRPLNESEVKEDYETNTGQVILECFKKLDPLAVPGVLVAGHAPFTWGISASNSVQNAIALEAVAAMGLDTEWLNSTPPELESYVLEKHYKRKHGKTAYYGQE